MLGMKELSQLRQHLKLRGEQMYPDYEWIPLPLFSGTDLCNIKVRQLQFNSDQTYLKRGVNIEVSEHFLRDFTSATSEVQNILVLLAVHAAVAHSSPVREGENYSTFRPLQVTLTAGYYH